jgi:hypothetical protein
MPNDYSEKGKIFTVVIPKHPVEVTIQTVLHRIHGEVYVRPEGRIKDELNQSDQFIAVTHAEVFDLNGVSLYSSPFLTLNTDHIIWLIPVEIPQVQQS